MSQEPVLTATIRETALWKRRSVIRRFCPLILSFVTLQHEWSCRSLLCAVISDAVHLATVIAEGSTLKADYVAGCFADDSVRLCHVADCWKQVQ